MNRTAVRLSAGWVKTAGLIALALVIGPMTAGCRSGGVEIGSGIRTTDDHGNSALDATVIVPDERNVSGQINFPSDVDWFKFRGIQGVGYALQIHGFPTDPTVRPDLDLNGSGRDLLTAQIVSFDSGTQLANSSGTQGGIADDVVPAGLLQPQGTISYTGDSRYVWICPTTNDYFINIRHRRNGIGAYRFRLASSQTTNFGLGLRPTLNTDPQTGWSNQNIVDTTGTVLFSGPVAGEIFWGGVEFLGSLGSTATFTINGLWTPGILLPGNTTIENGVIHMHLGFPNVLFPGASLDQTQVGGDTGHFSFLQVPVTFGLLFLPGARAERTTTVDGTMALPDGTRYRFPVTERVTENTDPSLPGGVAFELKLHLDDAVGESPRGTAVNVNAATFRSITGFDWYLDLHPQTNMAEESTPVAVSRPLADTYNMFETPLDAEASNVVLRDGSRLPAERGGSGFFFYYDSALKLFQVMTQILQVYQATPAPDQRFFSTVIEPDYAAFVGDPVAVYRGGPGQTGPKIIDLGFMPPVRAPRSASSTSIVVEPEGFKQAIRQLTDSEATTLRDAFYNGGFYVEVTDLSSGAPLMRAEGFLDISTFPTLNPCDLPPCSGILSREPPQKGTVTFALGTAGLGTVELYANGELLGTLSQPVSPDRLPVCGLEGDGTTLATELWPDTYYWHAHTKDGKMVDGHVTVVSGRCQMVLVK